MVGVTGVDCVTRDEFEAIVDELRDQIQEEGEENREIRDEIQEEREQRQELEEKVEEQQTLINALRNKTDTNKSRVEELQERELEKGAHLFEDNVDHHEVDVSEGRLERFKKEGGNYFRIPGAEDAVQRGGETTLAHDDLLPIQQLARMDDDMLASETKPVQHAAAVWRDREPDGGRL